MHFVGFQACHFQHFFRKITAPPPRRFKFRVRKRQMHSVSPGKPTDPVGWGGWLQHQNHWVWLGQTPSHLETAAGLENLRFCGPAKQQGPEIESKSLILLENKSKKIHFLPFFIFLIGKHQNVHKCVICSKMREGNICSFSGEHQCKKSLAIFLEQNKKILELAKRGGGS